jgi:hypothetical protein
MTTLTEHARRHGPFDPRFRLRRPKRVIPLAGPHTSSDIAGWEDEGGALRETPPALRTLTLL